MDHLDQDIGVGDTYERINKDPEDQGPETKDEASLEEGATAVITEVKDGEVVFDILDKEKTIQTSLSMCSKGFIERYKIVLSLDS